MHVSLDCLLCVPSWGPSDELWTTTDFHFVKTAAREFVALKRQIFRSGRGPRSEESKRPLSSLGGNPSWLVTDSGRFLQLSTRDKRAICCGSLTPSLTFGDVRLRRETMPLFRSRLWKPGRPS